MFNAIIRELLKSGSSVIIDGSFFTRMPTPASRRFFFPLHIKRYFSPLLRLIISSPVLRCLTSCSAQNVKFCLATSFATMYIRAPSNFSFPDLILIVPKFQDLYEYFLIKLSLLFFNAVLFKQGCSPSSSLLSSRKVGFLVIL